jgi:hypothetical protein
MKAISLRSPWWWFVLHGGKDIENRGSRFPRTVRGRVLLHVSKWWNLEEVADDVEDALYMRKQAGLPQGIGIGTTYREMMAFGGCLVGAVDIVDYVTKSDSPWFMGELGLVLRNPVAFRVPIPCRGALGFFDVPDVLCAQIPELGRVA